MTKTINKPLRISGCAVAVLSVCLLSFSAFAAEQAIKSITTSAKESATVVDVGFSLPLDYKRHFPQRVGEILQIQLQLTSGDSREIYKEVKQGGEIPIPDGQDQLLIYVTYEEGVPGGPYLTLRFTHPVRFEVDSKEGSKQLSITLFNDQFKDEPAQVTTPPASDTAAGEDTSTQPPQQSQDDITMETLRRQLFKDSGKSEEILEAKKEEEAQRRETDKSVSAQAGRGDTEVGELMAKARQALTFGDNNGAIELLRRVIALPENEHTRDARELVGLALERAGQIARAKFEYKKYLKIYKEGDGSVRVQQRLTALQNLGLERSPKLRRARGGEEGDSYTVFGRWSQSFSTRFQQREPQNDDDQVDFNDLVLTRRVDSHISVRGRYRASDHNIQTVFTANQTFDLIDRGDTENRISALYVDYDAFADGYSVVAGRQRVRNSGVFNRFDGVYAGYDLIPWVRTSVFLGKPVELVDDRRIERQFWGTKIDLGQKNDPLNMNVYLVAQSVGDYSDRRAVGLGVRYSKREMTLFGLLDYDVLFDEVNLFNVRWGWQYFENSKFNVSYNRRKLLFTSSALNNQPPTTTMDDVVRILGEEETRQLASDRTNDSDTFTFGHSYQFDRDNQLNIDFTVFSSTGTVTRNDLQSPDGCTPDGEAANCTLKNIAGAPGTGNQYTLSGQFIAGNLFAERDLYVFGGRFSEFDTYTDLTLFANSRLPIWEKWKPRPRVAFSYRTFAASQSASAATGNRIALEASVIVDYQWKKEWVLEMEIGAEYVQYSDEDFPEEFRQNIRIGYSYTF